VSERGELGGQIPQKLVKLIEQKAGKNIHAMKKRRRGKETECRRKGWRTRIH
jgi:hypothetical protein